MEQTNNMSALPFFNWSLRKALDSEPESFIKAKIRLIFTILTFSLLKAVVVIAIATAYQQSLQIDRAIIAAIIYTALIKVLLYRPSQIKLLAHLMIMAGILIVFSNIFLYTHTINLLTVQFVFMIVLSGFYTLGAGYGFVYAFISIVPVICFLLFGNAFNLHIGNGPQQLASPGFEIIAILNFISIIIAHYLFFDAFHDNIREKEKLNQQLQLAVKEANKMAESKSNFLSTISHELRTPLNSVIGITELLIQDNKEEKQVDNLKILQQSSHDLLSLINNVLDFNKSDSDKIILEAAPFNLSDFIHSKCSQLRMKAQDKGLDFIIDIDAQLQKLTVVSDPTRLSQIIYNLVSNAIKFTDKGYITVKLACINKTADGVDVLFSVTDTGIGIHPDRHDAVFELFTQAESNTTRKYGGTGLGLAIVKQVLRLFGSSIQLTSSPGTGTRFSFTISFATALENSFKQPAPGIKTDLSHLKILIAEDNDVNRFLVKKQLEKINLTATIVENGMQAYEACLADDYDAILMDLHMPVLNGYETTKQLRTLADPLKSKVHIIAFTASITEQEKIFENGFNDFLYKPININDLYEKLEKIAAREKPFVIR